MPRSKTESVKAEKLSERKADQFVFKSKIQGPVADMSMLERSVLFAEVSMIAYLSIEAVSYTHLTLPTICSV